MPKPDDVGVQADRPTPLLHLLAGQLWVGRRAQEVRTLLGSCVGVVLWSPAHAFGAMCHFLLPERTRTAGMARDGRFGVEAMEILVETLARHGAHPRDFDAHLYGGADTMPDRTGVKFNVGERNIELGWSLIDQHGFRLVNVDVGENCPRTVALSTVEGQVAMRRGGGQWQVAA